MMEQETKRAAGSVRLFHSEKERTVNLTTNEQDALLAISPDFHSILKAEYFDNYDLPCPVRVTIETKDGAPIDVVLRQSRHGDVAKEIQVFRALEDFGLPVPIVLADPFANESGESEAVYSLLPGENLQKLSMHSEESLKEAKELLVHAVTKLMDATPFIEKHEVANLIPRLTLSKELALLEDENNPWLREKPYKSAIDYLQDIVGQIDTPLIISNGDYQPGNFLTQRGKITGYLDFESASFQDPIMGFVKYPIYDLLPLSRTDVVETFLHRKGFSEEDFRIRLALGCLRILNREIPVAGGDLETRKYRSRVLRLLQESS